MIADLLHGWAEIEAAYPGYAQAETYYDGRPSEVFADPRVAAELGRMAERYRFNFAKTPVNVLASRVTLSGITVPGSEALTDELTEVLDANDMDVHFPDAILRAFEFGDSYLMVWPLDVEDDGEAGPSVDAATGSLADVQLVAAGVEITLHDPKHTRLIYDAENERRKAFQIRRWAVRGANPNEKVWRVDLYYADVIERWVSVQGSDLKQSSGWTQYLDDEQDPGDWELENPFGEIPWFHFRTEIPYGKPIHEPGYGCQDAINKLLITELSTVDSHGLPQRYALVDKDAELDSANDGPNWEADENATGDGGEGTHGGVSSNIRFGPGGVTTLNGMKSVGQFDAADPAVFMGPAESFIRFMAQICETPFHAFDPSGDVPSGESLKVAEAPLVKRARRFTTMFTSPLVEMSQFILKARGARVSPVEVRWSPIESATGVDDWTIVAAKQAAGVPVDQTLIEAGYETEQVGRWMDGQAEAMDLGHRVDLLGKIGTAVQSIGSGVALGVVSQEEASRIIAMVLDQAGQVETEQA